MGNEQGQPVQSKQCDEILNNPEFKQAVEFYKVYKENPLSVVYNPETKTCNAVCGPIATQTEVKPPLNMLLLLIVFVVGLALGYAACSYFGGRANNVVGGMQSMPVYQQV